jgi:hypothetical protein
MTMTVLDRGLAAGDPGVVADERWQAHPDSTTQKS